MHLQGEIGSLANDNTTKMSGGAVDVRLRRQNLVSVKPPRLRLGARPASSHQHQSRRQQQHKTASWSSGIEATTQEPNGNAVGDSAGITELTYNANENRKGSPSHSGGSSNRPLIHHQRHNLKTRFQLLKTLGEGTYGKVKLAADKATGEHVAIKYIKKTKIQDENDLVRIRREIQILSNLRHQHIVNIREVFEKKDKIVLVMDYAQGGELYDYLNKMGKLSEWEARRIFRQIVSAIHYCHQNNIVHRDLKLENIILDDEGNVKIADFGLSNYYSHNSTLKTFCGSPLYASPEIVNGKPYHGPEVDVWSLGVILYTLVYGAMPFESNSLVSLKQQISDGDYNQPSKPSDAAGLIRHMLTVTPSRRATIEDALRHWWINFGHNNMPNGMRYSPDDEPPIMQYTLTAESTRLDPPVIIHHRNQSSISSDSDVELDFRPLRWTKRSMTLDSTGNSVSSSIAGSPAPFSDGCNNTADHTDDCDDDPAVVAAGLQKLPPDVLEILKGCSSRSLAALLNTDKISTGFDLDPSDSSSNPTCQTAEEQNREETVESEKSSTSVFDSERKPKRGILKRKGKFSGGDSGCVMPEEMTAHSEDNPIPKSGHLPRRLPSFRDEAHGIFASKHRASQLLDNASGTLQHESCNSAISHAAWCYTPPHSRRQQHHHHQQHPHSHHSETPHHTHTPAMQPHNSCLTNPDHTTASDFINDNVPTSLAISDDNSGIPTAPRSPKEEPCHPDSASSASSCDIVVSKDPAKVVHRPKSILKNSKLNEARNRLSVSSIGSNSSADILDLSYDSGDSDHFVNQALSLSPDDGGLLIDSVQALDQNCASDSQVVSGNSSGLSYNSHQAAFSDDSAEILDSKSSMLYRLTRDAQTLL